MGFQPGAKKPRGSNRAGFVKPVREKGKSKKAEGRRAGKTAEQIKPILSAQQIAEVTLKQLHTLGSQKFGFSPFSQHFDRWLTDIRIVLSEFESNPNVGVDEDYISDRSHVVASIEQQLGARRRKDDLINEQQKNLLNSKNQLEQIKNEYVAAAREVNVRRRGELKRINNSIESLKLDQDEVIKMKTGFFHGVSKKKREQRELEITQRLAEEQQALEVTTLDFRAAQEKVRDEYEKKSAPFFNQIKKFQKQLEEIDRDDSLEDRWFACEALIDAVNNYLIRRKESATDAPNKI